MLSSGWAVAMWRLRCAGASNKRGNYQQEVNEEVPEGAIFDVKGGKVAEKGLQEHKRTRTQSTGKRAGQGGVEQVSWNGTRQVMAAALAQEPDGFTVSTSPTTQTCVSLPVRRDIGCLIQMSILDPSWATSTGENLTAAATALATPPPDRGPVTSLPLCPPGGMCNGTSQCAWRSTGKWCANSLSASPRAAPSPFWTPFFPPAQGPVPVLCQCATTNSKSHAQRDTRAKHTQRSK